MPFSPERKAQLLTLQTQLFLFLAMINQSVQLTRVRTGQARNRCSISFRGTRILLLRYV
jgi:hypothetical protein